MKLKSFGCSFIHGTDLADADLVTVRGPFRSSRLTWPSLLAQRQGWNYQCCAWPGAGNLQILNRLLTELINNIPAVYVINWTYIDRFDYTAQNFSGKWNTIMPTDTGPVANTFYKNVNSEFRDKLTSLINVKLAIDSLRASGNKFIMTYMDELMFDQQWNTTPVIRDLQNYCKPYMTQFDGKNFLDWSKEKGFPISKTHHPLEAAHQAAFKLIESYNLV